MKFEWHADARDEKSHAINLLINCVRFLAAPQLADVSSSCWLARNDDDGWIVIVVVVNNNKPTEPVISNPAS